MDGKRAGYSLEVTNYNKDRNTYHCEVKLPMELGWFYNVKLLVDDGGRISYRNFSHKENKGDYAIFEGDITLETSTIYRYCFSYDLNGKTYYFNKNGLQNNAFSSDDCFKLNVNFKVPEWAQGKIMYHIFVDRFNKSDNSKLFKMPRRVIHNDWNEEMHLGANKEISKMVGKEVWNVDFYGGDLNGITEKLDYIKSLGVSILYLSPIVYSQSNHRYDTSDYENVDPYAGCNEDLKVLCDEAHKRGMKVILDAVFNHTGNDSKYFDEYKSFGGEGAYNNPTSKYSNFYKRHYENGKIIYEYWWGYGNLLNRKTFPWGREDVDLQGYFKHLGKIRNDETFLQKADLKIRDINSDYFSYERIGLNDKMFVITNRSGKESRILLPPDYNDEKAKIYTLNKSTKDIITPYGAVAIKKAY